MTDTTQTPEPIWQDAISLCRDLQSGVVTATTIMDNVYARIEAFNPKLNAIVNLLDYDAAMELARSADSVPIAERGILHGLPMALKDAVAMKGFPTTWGFKPFADRIETMDDGLAALTQGWRDFYWSHQHAGIRLWFQHIQFALWHYLKPLRHQ